MLTRICALMIIALAAPILIVSSDGDDSTPGYVVDFAPVAQAVGNLDAKIQVKSKTAKGDRFERGLKINGLVRQETATNLVFALKTLYEGQEWKIKEIGKTKLLVIGKGDNPVEALEIEVKGLDKKYHPTVKHNKRP